MGELWLRGSQDHEWVALGAIRDCTEQRFRGVRTTSLGRPTKVPSCV
jgi:hypothetical protein